LRLNFGNQAHVQPAKSLPNDPAELKAMIAALQAENAQIAAENAKMAATLRAHDQLVQTLSLRIAKLQKLAFGKSSEKVEREIEQLELALEDLLVAVAEKDDAPIDEGLDEPVPEEASAPVVRRRPRVSYATPRERRELDPGACCTDCGGDLRVVGEDVSELLDMIAAQMKVIQIAQIKKSCRRCERMVQEPAPSRPIPGSMAGPNLLAHVLVLTFDDDLPLYRQHGIFERMGADIPDSTLVGWCGRAMKTLSPLIERIDADILSGDLLHADDTPIRVLDRSRRDKGLGKGVKQGRVWAYVRDQRPWAGAAPPGAVYRFAPNWKEEHVLSHLADARGILQADGYKGYANLYVPKHDGSLRLREAACWAHLRRDFHDFGPPPIPRLRVRRSTGSVSSTILSATSTAKPQRPALRPVKGSANQRWRPSLIGPNNSSCAFPARAIWPRPSAMASVEGMPSTSS
jgi:transposase